MSAEQHRRGGTEIRMENKDRTGAELGAGRHERQVEVKLDAYIQVAMGMVECNAG